MLAGILTGFWFGNMLEGYEIAEKIASYQVGRNQIEIYRTNEQGALGAYSIEIRQVWPILPGVKWVNCLDSFYGQSSLEVTHVGRQKFSYIVEPYRSFRDVRKEVTITFKP